MKPTEYSLSPNPQTRWFTEEVQSHEGDLRAWLRRRFPDATDIDDVIQESYVRLLRSGNTGSIACARAYLFTTARNVALALLRRPKIFSPLPEIESEVLDIANDATGVAEQVSTRQEVAMLLDAIDALPKRCREIFILHKLHGVPRRDIATRLGISVQTVQVQVTRGAHRCLCYLRQHGVDRRGPRA